MVKYRSRFTSAWDTQIKSYLIQITRNTPSQINARTPSLSKQYGTPSYKWILNSGSAWATANKTNSKFTGTRKMKIDEKMFCALRCFIFTIHPFEYVFHMFCLFCFVCVWVDVLDILMIVLWDLFVCFREMWLCQTLSMIPMTSDHSALTRCSSKNSICPNTDVMSMYMSASDMISVRTAPKCRRNVKILRTFPHKKNLLKLTNSELCLLVKVWEFYRLRKILGQQRTPPYLFTKATPSQKLTVVVLTCKQKY